MTRNQFFDFQKEYDKKHWITKFEKNPVKIRRDKT